MTDPARKQITSPYDFLVVGSGPFGASFARLVHDKGYRVLVVEKKQHVAGHIYTEMNGYIPVHVYGPHIFHTSNERVWAFANRFCKMNHFVNSPLANYKGDLYNLPFNMNTFYQLWGLKTPEAVQEKLAEARLKLDRPARNLEEQALSLVGEDVYRILIKEYTEKQWGRPCDELPAFIIRRLPLRFTYDNNYFNDPYQGIPEGGYTPWIERMLSGIDLRLQTDFLNQKEELQALADRVIYTGAIDAYYDYCYGPLAYRSLRFETERLEVDNVQGVAVMNYTSSDEAYTRVIEHKHFAMLGETGYTVVSREYPAEWQPGDDAYYPVNDETNQLLYKKYADLAAGENNVYFGGRLAGYRYFNMDQVIAEAMDLADKLTAP